MRTRLRRDLFYTFDIETTTLITGLDEHSNPIRNGIIWSGQFYDGDVYYSCRSLEEVIAHLKFIGDTNDKLGKICIFVHNLGYEFQFIKDFFQWENILCTDTRKIISAETDKLVFRCSYMLSNMGLAKFLQNEGVPERYQKTNMDYLKLRFPWTPTTKEEDIYRANDVIGLHIAIQHRIDHEYNQDINNLPLTSTGYVRKDCRKAFNSNKNNRWRFYEEKLDLETLQLLHEAFRGGNTHANREHANKTKEHVGQKDERSAYPAALMFEKYPTKFFDIKPFRMKEFNWYMKHTDDYAILFEVTFKNVRLIHPELTPVPYISISKCKPIKFNTDTIHAHEVDNGRVLSCEFARMVLTEQDYLIIQKQYTWDDMAITRCKVSKKKYIPQEIRDEIMKYYFNKTTLKQDDSDPDYDEDIAYLYARSKEKLNGIYGMHVSYPCKPTYIWDDKTKSIVEEPSDEAELLEEYYKSFSSFLSYQVGIWVTAYARRYLQEGIDEIGSDLLYCDTDSLKYLNPEEHEAAIQEINNKRIRKAEEVGAYVDYEGERYHLGIFTDEGIVEKFKTFGAKKYIYGSDDHFKITISGVPKKAGAECIQKAVDSGKLKSPFDLKKGFVFHGIKTTSCYMDYDCLHYLDIDGHRVYYASNIAMYPNSYTLGLTQDYEVLLDLYKDEMED